LERGAMGVPVINTGPMTVEEFYAFTDTRPDEEKWELIDGEPILNAAPSRLHRRIVKNLILGLGLVERRPGLSWESLPGLGVRVSNTNRPEPDLLILPRTAAGDATERDRTDVIVAFEVLSPSTQDRDLRWKRAAYTSLPSLTHYVVIAQDTVEVVVFARSRGFAEQRLSALDDVIDLPTINVALPLSEVYRDVHLPLR
jgi:Uma2 family endonuclease